jgi:hypothetical protein
LHQPANNTTAGTTDDLAASLLTPKQEHHNHHYTAITNPEAANRAMSHTGAWKPALDRRQSWNAQEYKHEVQMRECEREEKRKGGFSEV